MRCAVSGGSPLHLNLSDLPREFASIHPYSRQCLSPIAKSNPPKPEPNRPKRGKLEPPQNPSKAYQIGSGAYR